MNASQLASAAAAAANEAQSAKAGSVIKELAQLTVQLSHEPLQARTAQVTLEWLQMCEEHAQKCVVLLVDALRTPGASPELACDATWTLNKLAQRCPVTRQWMLDASGLDVVVSTMLYNSANHDLIQCSVGIVYNLRGLGGLDLLLKSNVSGNTPLTDPVLAAVIWAVYDVFKAEKSGIEDVSNILRTLVQLLSHGPRSLEVQNASCSVLAALVHDDARFGLLLMQLGATPLLLEILQHAMNQDGYAEDLACSCVNILASLAEASATQAEVIRQNGGVEVLARFGTRGYGGYDEEAAITALGHLAGISAVLQVMSHAPSQPSVIRGGLDAITELASSLTAPHEVQQLPEVLHQLGLLLDQMDGPHSAVKCRKKCLAAICSTMIGIASFAEPGQVVQLDEVIVALLKLQTQDMKSDEDFEIASETIESLGRLALIRPAWCEYLKHCGAEQVFKQRICSGHAHRRLLKYVFWAAGALSGLPFVCSELRNNLRNSDMIDSAFCTIIDILDDDLEGDWVLKGTDQCNEYDVPGFLSLVAEAMRGYMSDSLLQSRGCHCIGLIVSLSPQVTPPPDAIAAAFSAVRRHPHCASVVRDVLYVFHSLLEPTGGIATQTRNPQILTHIVETMHEGGADAIARQALTDFSDAHHSDLIEEAVIVLCSLSSVDAALDALTHAGPGPVRTIGVKAIGEFGRHQPHLLRKSATDIASAVVSMAAESAEDDVLQQNVALLVGLCNAYTGA